MTETTSAATPVLVTGATGFLGSHLLPLLLRDSEPVRVLARQPAPELSARGVEVVVGDVVSGAGLDGAVEGVKRVFHLAGRVSRDPDAAASLQRVHVDGARTLAAAARRAGVERILLVSTSGTIAVSRDPEPDTDETAPVPIELIGGWPYYRSKWLQERALLADAGDIEVVIVNPSLLLGPGDERLSSTGDVLRFLSGQLSVIPPGGLNFVDVRDAAAGVVAAMAKGRAGQRYLLGGHNWSFQDFFARLAEVSGSPAPRLRLSRGLYTAGALLTEEVARQVGREPAVDRISREMAACYWYFSSEKATRELGHDPRDGRVTLLETVNWFRGREAGERRSPDRHARRSAPRPAEPPPGQGGSRLGVELGCGGGAHGVERRLQPARAVRGTAHGVAPIRPASPSRPLVDRRIMGIP